MKKNNANFERMSPVQLLNKSGCLHCGACASACPVGAISFNSEGFPVVNENICIKCKTCVSICPVEVIKIEEAK